MRVNAQELVDHISKISLGGLVNEVVLGEDLTFAVINEGRSVISICSKGLTDYKKEEIGIFNLDLFSRAIQYAKDVIFSGEAGIDIDIVENRLIFKKGDDELKFLLSNPKVVSSTVDNSKEILEKVSQSEAVIVRLTSAIKDKCLKAIQLVNPEKCTFISVDGKVGFYVGKDSEHNITVDLGNGKGKKAIKLVLKPDFLSKVLSALPVDKDVILELREDMPLVLDMDGYVFLVFPMDSRE